MKKKYKEEEILIMLKNKKEKSKAFSMIVEEYSQQLYWQIRKMLISHDDSNDVLQETFIKAWRAIENFRGDAKLSSWLYRIAVNESLSFLNAQRRKHTFTLLEVEDLLIERLESDAYFSEDEAQMKLQKAILQLPEKQRLVFNMKYFDDLKYEEISEILGVTVGGLKASYHIASKKIKKYLLSEH